MPHHASQLTRRLRHLASAIILLMPVPPLLAAPEPPATAARSWRQLDEAVIGWQQTMLDYLKFGQNRLKGEELARQERMVRHLRIVATSSPAPMLRRQLSARGPTIWMSAQWLALLEELVRAGMINDECQRTYFGQISEIIKTNEKNARAGKSTPTLAWPRLDALTSADASYKACRPSPPERPDERLSRYRIAQDVEAALFVLLNEWIMSAARVPANYPDPTAFGLTEPKALGLLRDADQEVFDEETRELLMLPVSPPCLMTANGGRLSVAVRPFRRHAASPAWR